MTSAGRSSWAINGRFLSQPFSGVQRYSEEIVRAIDGLLEERPVGRLASMELVCPAGSRKLDGLQHIRQVFCGDGQGHRWEQMTLPKFVKGGLLSLGNTGPLRVSKQIVCIHDLNTRQYPQSYSRPFRMVYRVLLPMLARRTAAVTTVSAYSKSQIVNYRLAKAPDVTVAPNGYEHAAAWTPEHSPATRQAAGPKTIVMIGSMAPHKNLALMLRISRELVQSGFTLAVAGSLDHRVFAQSSALQSADENIVWLGRLSNNELAALLRDSLCLAFPSYTEGFGLPALEAMALGCPVVASNRASIPEVCGNAALYADPDDDAAWINHFRHLGSDTALRDRLSELGKIQARQFSWIKSAQTYLDLIDTIAV